MAVVVATNALTTPKRTWADIVKGCAASDQADFALNLDELRDSSSVLKPGKRGERRCFCQGEILVMLGHYGWIMTFDPIDHPDVWKTGGRVYVHKRDLPKGQSVSQGDTVSFYLYSDDQGLGAECCRVDEYASSGLDADANEFVPGAWKDTSQTSTWNVGAVEFVPSSFNAHAAEFVPDKFHMSSGLQGCSPPSKCLHGDAHILATINPAFLSDDESDDEVSTACDDQLSDVDDSTSTGGGSISCELELETEAEDAARFSFRLPPGLSLPPGFRPPPGLSLPAIEA
jgi:hypothetical protein